MFSYLLFFMFFNSCQDEWNAIIYANVNKHEVCVKLLKAAGVDVSYMISLVFKNYSLICFSLSF